jgi:hypothetical protein
MKILLVFLFPALSFFAKAQDVYKSVAGEISFFSEAPLENIHAVNKEGRSLINTANNEVAVVVAIRGFKFEKALMEEHFNENYLESHKYKTAHFKGLINENIDFSIPGKHKVSATGDLEVHGVKQLRTIEGEIEITESGIELKSSFQIALKDHKINYRKYVIFISSI